MPSTVHVVLYDGQLDALRESARENDRSISSEIRRAVRLYLEAERARTSVYAPAPGQLATPIMEP